jgi:hypothetical protein
MTMTMSDIASALAKQRWAVATPEQRDQPRQAGKLGGRPRSADRCPCGRFTRAYAAKRGHKCEAQERQ